jgi:hypothetical protein
MTTRTVRHGLGAGLLALGVGLCVLAGGCFDSDHGHHHDNWREPPGGDHHDNPHWQLWRLQQIHDYQYVWAERCFCRGGGQGPYLVQVRNDAVFRVWSIAGDSLLPNNRGTTIDDLFDLTESGLTVEVDYHPVLGYPMSIAIDVPEMKDVARSITVYRLSSDVVAPAEFCWCRGTGTTAGYGFTALDSTGVPLVEGCLDLAFTETLSLSFPERIDGTRCLDVLGTLPAPYAFRMAEVVSGAVSQFGEITIDLNGRTRDSNIILTGRYDGEARGNFSGRWVYLTMHGEADHGSFTAVRWY